MKITMLEIANFKRIKAVRIQPNETGFTIIGGKNCQGKTSVIDAIQFAFGGYKFKPTNMKREGSVGDMVLRFETDNGLTVDRHGKEGKTLTVTDRNGKRGGQALLDAFLSELAINLPKFHDSDSRKKAQMLLGTLKMTPELAEKCGVKPDTDISEVLAKFDREEKEKYDTRTVIGQQEDQKRKAANDMPYYEDAPEEPVSVKELIESQQEILSRNGVKEAAKAKLEENRRLVAQHREQVQSLKAQIETIEASIATLEKSIANAEGGDFSLESTEELVKQIADHEEINRKVNANAERTRRVSEADELAKQFADLTKEIEAVRKERIDLLNGVKFPLEGLSVENGELSYHGKAWDCMSGSEQLVVDIAIASSLNPECKFVLLDKMEQLDIESLHEADKWLVEHDIQCIATRVSTNADNECSFVIEDGEVEGSEGTAVEVSAKNKTAPKPLSDSDY